MKRCCHILVFIFLLANKNMSAQNFQWAQRAGLYAFDLGYGVGTDNAGNVYIAGKYEMNAYFGGTYVSCAGNHDIYIAKYSPSGVFKWVRTAGGTSGDYAHAIAVDGAGNSYITGEFEYTAHFGSVSMSSNGSNDVFVAKYDTNGNLIWAKRLGGGGGSDKGLGITLSNGNVYVTGNFQGGNFSGTSLNTSGAHDIFIAKYTTDGIFQWAKKAGGSGEDEGFAISNDPAGNIYVTGYFSGTANFSGTYLSSNGGTDIFLAKYNSNGSLIWVKKFGAGANDVGNAIKVDKNGRIFVTGGFRYTTNFGSTQLKTPNGNSDIFIACFDSSGNVIWAKKAGGGDNDTGRGIAVDGNSNVFITGNCGISATFGSSTINGADVTEIFFASYDVSGNYRWVLKAGGSADVSDPNRFIEMGLSISTDPSGNVLASGAYRSSSTFGGTTLSPFSTHTQIYVTKIGSSSPPPPPPDALCSATGSITRDFWANVNGTTIASVPFNTAPTSTSTRSLFEGPSQAGDNYGSRIRGYVCPPTTGNYIFWIASDNNSELWLSTNDQQSSKVKIASVTGYTGSRAWTKYPTQQSATIYLTAGKKYFIEALHCEGSQGDNLAVGWQLPGGALERPIPGGRLSPFGSSTPPPPSNQCTATGTITRDLWTNITGSSVSNVPVNSTPTSTSQRTIFEGPSQAGPNYGSRIRGYICPPSTGNYIFWIASDNNSELWLSTNNQPSNKVKIASVTGWTLSRQWTKYSSQKSASIHLTAGTSYFIEAIHKEETMGDNLAVGWQLPDGSMERPIPGTRLSPYSPSKNGLPDSDLDSMLANSLIPKITPSKTTAFCVGSDVILKTMEDSTCIYNWKKDGEIIAGAAGPIYRADSPGSYSVMKISGSDTLTSEPTILIESRHISVSIAPSDPIFCQDTNTVLIANTGDEFEYEWKRNGITIPGANQKSYETDESGDYQVKIIYGSCVDWSAITKISLQDCAIPDSINNTLSINSIDSYQNNDDSLLIKIFPNPNSGLFTIEINMIYLSEQVEQATLEILNSIGQVVYHKLISFDNGYLNEHVELGNSIPTGVYFLQVTIGDKAEKTRMMLAR